MTDRAGLNEADVIVVGAGPTGLTMANLLGRQNVNTILVERNLETVQEPRAVSIDDESLRTLQSVGVIDKVLTEIVPGYGSEYRTRSGHCFLKVAPEESPYGYPRRNAFRQPILEAQLREQLEEFPTVRTLFGWRLISFEQRPIGVQLKLENDQGQSRQLSCRFLVGTDGAKSTIREALGIELEGKSFGEQWLIIDLENSPASSRETQVYCDYTRPCIALPGPRNTRRFEFKLLPGEDPEGMTEPAVVENLLKRYGAAPDSKIRRKAVYTFHARVAPEWSKGSVFLAGDACHLTPPFAGQGMNSGIRDAHNLAWKLASVVQGRLGRGVLETYQPERQPHAQSMIDLALTMGRVMAPSNWLDGALTQGTFRLLSAWPRARNYFAEMRYKPKPRFSSGFVLDNEIHGIESPVGRLLPQPSVISADGAEVLLDDLLGEGFSIVAITSDAGRLSEAAELAEFKQLDVRMVAISPELASPVANVVVACDPSGALARVCGNQADVALLLRPDRYVLGSFHLHKAREFAGRLGMLINQTYGGEEDLDRAA